MTQAPTKTEIFMRPRREAQRQIVVRAVFFIFFLSMLEGPLRKWFLPGSAGPLALLRDPFVLILYAYAFANGLIALTGLARAWLLFATITALFGLIQYILNGYGSIGWLLGVRSYWLYLPLGFVVAKSFRREDVLFFFKLNLWLAIPYAALVASQYSAGASALVNRGVGGDETAAVGLNADIVRPFGLFTYTGPNVDFTTAMVAMLLAVFLAGPPVRLNWLLFLVMVGAVSVMAVLTGSRSIYFSGAIIFVFCLLGLLLAKPTGKNIVRALLSLGFVAFAGAALVFIFPDMFSAMETRFEQAARSEGDIWNRVLDGPLAWIDSLFIAPYGGYGIGLGAGGVARFLDLPTLLYGESDLERNVNELGFFLGLCMIALRLFTSIWLVWFSYKQARIGNFVILPLVGFLVVPISFGAITYSPITAFLPWLFVGFAIALRRTRREEKNSVVIPA